MGRWRRLMGMKQILVMMVAVLVVDKKAEELVLEIWGGSLGLARNDCTPT